MNEKQIDLARVGLLAAVLFLAFVPSLKAQALPPFGPNDEIVSPSPNFTGRYRGCTFESGASVDCDPQPMRMALFERVSPYSTTVTWIGEGYVDGEHPPDAIFDSHQTTYTNLALEGATSWLKSHPGFEAAYVIDDDTCLLARDELKRIRLFKTMESVKARASDADRQQDPRFAHSKGIQ